MGLNESELIPKLKAVRLVTLDCDGVLTDGRIQLGEDGREFRCFDVKDGFGIRALILTGVRVALISGRESEVVKRRCENLGIENVYQHVMNKRETCEKLIKKYGMDWKEVCFVGDDVNDLTLLGKAGLSVCVADAAEELKERCDYVTSREGGRGAVREIAERILKAQGKWDAIVEKFS